MIIPGRFANASLAWFVNSPIAGENQHITSLQLGLDVWSFKAIVLAQLVPWGVVLSDVFLAQPKWLWIMNYD